MPRACKQIITVVPLLGFVGVCVVVALWDAPIHYLTALLSSMGFLSYVAFVLLVVLAVVFAPITVMPLIPMAAMILGPLATALLSIVGWTLGAVIAFLISRYLGRPVLLHFISLQKIDAFAETMQPRTRFFVIVLMRLTLPVDLASYALGLAKSVGIVEYTLATVIGVTWFSFVFAYLGEALIERNAMLLLELTAPSLLIFGGAWYLLKKRSQ